MKIVSSGPILRFMDYQKEVDVDAATVGDGLTRLVEAYPDLRRMLYDSSGRLQSYHKLYLNAERLSDRELERQVRANDELQIVTAVAGG